MKCIVLTVLLCAVALEATPHRLGLVGAEIGSEIGAGIGDTIGTGVGLGIDGVSAVGDTAIGAGLGAVGLGTGVARGLGTGLANGLGVGLGLGGQISRGQSGYANGGKYGNNRVSSGASGITNQGYHNEGASNFHDRGQHKNKVTSITQSEQSDAHDIGGGQAYNTGAHGSSAFNKHHNGNSNYGSNYGQGNEGHERIID
ncbi:unnamed protein product, partial [Brenthis ino]